MADVNMRPQENNILRRRGDTFRILFELIDEDGAPVDITGWTFLFTVDPAADPADDTNNLFQRAGVIQDGPGGIVRVGPFLASEVQTPGDYYYDLEGTDTAGAIRTVSRGYLRWEQDITKEQ